MPVGKTAKIRSGAHAAAMEQRFRAVAAAFGVHVSIAHTDGAQPVGRGIGPSLEARDVLQVLRGDPSAPADLRERGLSLAAALLALSGEAGGAGRARILLDDGTALRKFLAICEAQGGFAEPLPADHVRPVFALRPGLVRAVDNRRLAKVAKLAGAPLAQRAGVFVHARVGDRVAIGDPLFDVHAQSRGELDYALSFVSAHPDIFDVG
jgi:thymidine phosphorylase